MLTVEECAARPFCPSICQPVSLFVSLSVHLSILPPFVLLPAGRVYLLPIWLPQPFLPPPPPTLLLHRLPSASCLISHICLIFIFSILISGRYWSACQRAAQLSVPVSRVPPLVCLLHLLQSVSQSVTLSDMHLPLPAAPGSPLPLLRSQANPGARPP